MDYNAWNAAIVDHFFSRDAADKPSTLQVDPDELALIAGFDDPQLAKEDFVAAVQIKVKNDQAFERIYSDTFRWNAIKSKIRETAPPFVALLAASVLAGYDMVRDPALQLSSGAYYPRLNAILGFAGTHAPKGMSRIIEWWQRLKTWLAVECAGQRGYSTAVQLGVFPLIGWPLSQCTLRREDRLHLPYFFRWAGLRPHMLVDEGQLARDFTQWLTLSTCKLTPRTKTLLTTLAGAGRLDDALRDLILEYHRWDGSTVEAGSGARNGDIVLQAAEIVPNHVFALRFVALRPDGFPADRFTFTGAASSAELDLHPGEPGLYEPLDLEVMNSNLRTGFTLQRDHFRLRFDGGDIHVLEEDRELGDWVSRDQTVLGESYFILVCEHLRKVLEAVLQRHAGTGWVPISRGLPPGWIAFANVCFERPFTAPDALAPLSTKRQLEVHLRGGLKFSNDCWMLGALPFLSVSAGSKTPIDVMLDSSVIAHGVPPLAVPLWEHHVEEGEHRLSVADRTIRFRVARHAPPDSWRQDAHAAWSISPRDRRIESLSATFLSPDSPSLAGACLTQAGLEIERHVVKLVSGADGTIGILRRVPSPLVTSQKRLLAGQLNGGSAEFFTVIPSDGSAAWWWLSQHGRQTLTAAGPHPPPAPVTIGAWSAMDSFARLWAETLLTSELSTAFCTERCRESCKERYEEYRDAAARIMQRTPAL